MFQSVWGFVSRALLQSMRKAQASLVSGFVFCEGSTLLPSPRSVRKKG